jgi:hypothetical protein
MVANIVINNNSNNKSSCNKQYEQKSISSSSSNSSNSSSGNNLWHKQQQTQLKHQGINTSTAATTTATMASNTAQLQLLTKAQKQTLTSENLQTKRFRHSLYGVSSLTAASALATPCEWAMTRSQIRPHRRASTDSPTTLIPLTIVRDMLFFTVKVMVDVRLGSKLHITPHSKVCCVCYVCGVCVCVCVCVCCVCVCVCVVCVCVCVLCVCMYVVCVCVCVCVSVVLVCVSFKKCALLISWSSYCY